LPVGFFDFYKNFCYNIYRKLRKKEKRMKEKLYDYLKETYEQAMNVQESPACVSSFGSQMVGAVSLYFRTCNPTQEERDVILKNLATMLSDVNSYSQKLLRKQKSKEVSA
jgi:hypothetical protein